MARQASSAMLPGLVATKVMWPGLDQEHPKAKWMSKTPPNKLNYHQQASLVRTWSLVRFQRGH
jgi:hypothetical protein